MDLITQLPKTRQGHDAIAVFVDRLTKMTHFVPTKTSVTATQLAHIFFDEVYKHHGMPKVIVSFLEEFFLVLLVSRARSDDLLNFCRIRPSDARQPTHRWAT